MKKLLAFTLASALSTSVIAEVSKCQSTPIKGIQVLKNGDVLYVTWADKNTRKLGNLSQNPATQQMIPLLLIAIDKKLTVQFAYPAGYDCNKANELSTSAEWIYIQDTSS